MATTMYCQEFVHLREKRRERERAHIETSKQERMVRDNKSDGAKEKEDSILGERGKEQLLVLSHHDASSAKERDQANSCMRLIARKTSQTCTL
eukprot:scaffold128559_cov71-Attheya_sp.AAC.1